jgi:transposase-like protein
MTRVKRTCLHCKESNYVYKGGKYDRSAVFVCRSCLRGLMENFRQRVVL